MNNSYCEKYGSFLNDAVNVFPVYLPISFVGVLLSLATVAVVCKKRLHKTLVYRLAMYQVLSAIEFSIIWIITSILLLTPININFEISYGAIVDLELAYGAIVALLMGSSFIKLMFTVWISIHLFALAVFHKNLQRLERLYVVSSLLVPLVVTIVLLCINLTACSTNGNGFNEESVYIVIFAVLVLISLLMVVMGTILCHRACRRRNAILSEYDKQHKKALWELLPLLLSPIMYRPCCINIPCRLFALGVPFLI